MLVTADQLLAHAIGDYILQSDWMALEKTKKSVACLLHVLTYSIPFTFLTDSWPAILFIAGTHFVIDRWRLARYVVWAKNFIAPKWIYPPIIVSGNSNPSVENESTAMHRVLDEPIRNYPWSECSGTGYHKERPAFLAVWLLIAADNIMHIILNAVALKYLG